MNCVKKEFILNKKGFLLHKRRLYIANSEEIKIIIMNELHKRPIHDILDIKNDYHGKKRFILA